MKAAILPLTILMCAAPKPAQTQGPVILEPVKQLRKGVDAWPLVAHASTPAETRVNVTLSGLNEHLAGALKDCDTDYRRWAEMVHQPLTGKNAVEDDWERKVTVTMTGPRFLSIVAVDGYVFCGGAHPDSDTLAMVFDLTTGKRVDWMDFISESANASSSSGSNIDGTTVGALIIPALRVMTLAKADNECQGAFKDPQSYQLWPDAKSGALIAQPFDLPHVVAACAGNLELAPAQAVELGFNEALVGAIVQAHRKLVATTH